MASYLGTPMDDVVKLLNAVSALIGAVILPVVVLLVFRMFRIEINAFIHRTNRISGKIAGVDFSIEAQQAEAAGALEKAFESVEQRHPEIRVPDAPAAASIATRTITPTVVENASRSTILWVDDNPEHNVYERRALETIGATFVLARSTDDGLKRAQEQAFDVVISDMARGRDRTAGYTLIERLRKSGIQTPVVIYAGSATAEQRAEAKSKGALDATNRPDELFQLVVTVLNSLN